MLQCNIRVISLFAALFARVGRIGNGGSGHDLPRRGSGIIPGCVTFSQRITLL
jgi:hypothetical protein